MRSPKERYVRGTRCWRSLPFFEYDIINNNNTDENEILQSSCSSGRLLEMEKRRATLFASVATPAGGGFPADRRGGVAVVSERRALRRWLIDADPVTDIQLLSRFGRRPKKREGKKKRKKNDWERERERGKTEKF